MGAGAGRERIRGPGRDCARGSRVRGLSRSDRRLAVSAGAVASFHGALLEEQAIRGVPWSLLTYAGSKALTLAAIVVLAHLLPPGDFGLFSLALLAVGFFYMFRDLGLGATLILRQDRDDA